MNQILRQMAVMSLALVLLCACAVTQNESRSNTNIAVANSSGITFSPSPCEVYQGEKVDVFVTLPEGYDRIQFVNGTGTGEYYTAEICYVNNRLAIRVTGKSDKVFKGIQEETQEYCYDIAESIPNRGAIVEYLSRKNLMNEENK